MKYLLSIFTLIAPFFMNVSKAQLLENIDQKPQIVASSPQSQVFEKYINHPVTEYNGLPNIEMPLYTLELKGLKIPINLSYHAEGIKYKQYDGDIAAGWSINAGGYRVSRSIVGRPDELYPFYDQTYLASISASYDIRDAYLGSIVAGSEAVMAQNGDNIQRDGDLDQFSYMLPSHSGQFLISNRTSKAVDLVNDFQDKVALDENSSSLLLNDISIVDNSGFKYYMGGGLKVEKNL